jgi:chromosomal replication initiator protein
MKTMTMNDDECWSRVKGRLRSNVGEDVYSSWFARMDLESVSDGAAHMSVPTRFLKSWIQSHYADRVLSCWQAEMPTLQRVDLSVRSPVRQTPTKDNRVPVEELRIPSTAAGAETASASRPTPMRLAPRRSIRG